MAHQAAGRGTEQEDQQGVLETLGRPVAVGRHARRSLVPAVGQPAHGLVQGAEGADPTAKHPPQKDGQDQGEKPPQQAGVQTAGGDQAAQAHQGIELQQPVDRPAAQLPEALTQGGNEAKPHKEKKEENLADAAGGGDAHEIVSVRLQKGVSFN
ncbi:hypothetical protein DESC_690020 [Desulfosarcina cetonica]|nr:hypothetical protein DESC_690020 [Desulfosarcina cetonica]